MNSDGRSTYADQMNLVLRLVGVTAVAVAVSFAPTVPADAEKDAGPDKRHDVVRHSPDGEQVVRPRHHNGDIVRHSIRYGDRRITVRIRFLQLHHRARVLWIGAPVQWPMGGGEIGYGDIEIEVWRDGRAQGNASFGGDAECPVRSHIDYRRNLVRMSIPSACLGNPKRIRSYTTAYTKRGGHFFFDTSPDNPTGHPGVVIDRG